MGELIDHIVDFILDYLCVPLLSDPMYRRGFAAALFVAFIIGWLSRTVLAARGRILVFFAEVSPSLKSSPSGYNRMIGCLRGVVTLVIIAVVLLMITGSLLIALTRD